MKSPADVVTVLDSDVSSVSDPMNSANPANVLQTHTKRPFQPWSVFVCMAVTSAAVS